MVDVKVTVEGRSEIELLDGLLALFDAAPFNEAVAAVAFARWVELAYARLTKTRDEYIAGIQPPRAGDDGSMVIELVGLLPNLVEGGMSGYDFRQTHLKGRASRVIAFGHDAPGESAPLGYGLRRAIGNAAAKSLGRRVAKEAKKLQPGQRLPSGLAPTLSPAAHDPRRAGAPAHRGDIYAGLTPRTREPKSGGSGSRYLTFRTLSQNSPAGSWMHPGIEARDLASAVLDDMETLAPAVIDGVISAVLGES